jgi:transcription elongation factor GreB
MSRAFLKDDAVEDPVLVTPRAPLPAGQANYVTPRGLRLLHEERDRLEAERDALRALPADSNERKRGLTRVGGTLSLLSARIASARPVDPASQPAGEVRFGATVRLEAAGQAARTFTIVGVDEAAPARGLVPFTAPVAQTLSGKQPGDRVRLPGPRPDLDWTIAEIRYDDNA